VLIAHESIESLLDEMEAANTEELMRQRDRSTREFREGPTVSWEQVKAQQRIVILLILCGAGPARVSDIHPASRAGQSHSHPSEALLDLKHGKTGFLTGCPGYANMGIVPAG
jgi:hypothetical protein